MDAKTTVEVQEFIQSSLQRWSVIKTAKGGWLTSNQLSQAFSFLIKVIDEAIKNAELKQIPGSDKKAFVLAVVNNIYDQVIAPQLPSWAYVFSGVLKSFVIDNIVSNLIDYVVSQYKNGSWANGKV